MKKLTILLLMALIACSPSKDVLNVSRHQSGSPGARHGQVVVQDQTVPAIFYLMQANYIVGKGNGASVEAAKEKAIDDIIRQTIKALGQNVLLIETSNQSNNISGRSNVSSRSELSVQSRYVSDLGIPVRFDPGNIDSTFFNGRAGNYNYYIRYNLTSQYIEELIELSKRTEEAYAKFIKDLTNIDSIHFVEELFDKKNQIEKELKTPSGRLDNIQKTSLTNALIKLITIIDNFRIDQIHLKNENSFILCLNSLGKAYAYEFHPAIWYDINININESANVDGCYKISYSFQNYVEHPSPFEIILIYNEIELARIQVTSNNNPPPIDRKFKFMEPLNIEIISVNHWHDEVRQIVIQIDTEDDTFFSLVRAEITIRSQQNHSITLEAVDFTQSKLNETTRYTSAPLQCSIPGSLMRRASIANVTIFVEDMNRNLKMIPKSNVKIKPSSWP